MLPCIESIYSKNKNGYAYYYDTITKKAYLHHRFAYCEFHNVSVASIKGLCVCHKCDNPSCINVDHLFLGTQQENIADMVNKERQAKGETQRSAKLTEGEVLAIRGSSLSGRQLGEMYNVGESTISRILTRRTWKHI